MPLTPNRKGSIIMAHEFESGLFVKEEAWHKLGILVEEAPSIEEAYELSGLNWQVELLPAYCKVNGQDVDTGNFAIVRDKDSSVFGVVGDRYNPFQNKEAFDWCKPLVDSDYWNIETAGALKGGRVCWAMLKQGETSVVSNDLLKQYLLLTWSHDGSKSVQVAPTTIRVVCANTLQMALHGNKDISKVRHTASMIPRLEEVRKLYDMSCEAFKVQEEAFNILLDKHIETPEEYIDRIMVEVFGVNDLNGMKEGRGKTIANTTKDTLLEFATNGSGIKEQGVGNTLYGAFNGVSEALEHVIGGKRVKDRGYNVLFGNGKDSIQKAFNIAMDMATA